jgi:hypothetical protein
MRPMNGKTMKIERDQASMADQNTIRRLDSSAQNLNVHQLLTCSELP